MQTVVDEIKKTINMTVQNTLNTLEVDWNRSAHHFDQIEPYRIFGENELLEWVFIVTTVIMVFYDFIVK